jgi:hypothetical protein
MGVDNSSGNEEIRKFWGISAQAVKGSDHSGFAPSPTPPPAETTPSTIPSQPTGEKQPKISSKTAAMVTNFLNLRDQQQAAFKRTETTDQDKK